jgi:hypothetical protein
MTRPSRSTRARARAEKEASAVALVENQEASVSDPDSDPGSDGSLDSPKRAKIYRRIQTEEAKPVEEQDEVLINKLHEKYKAPLTDVVTEYGTDEAKKFDRVTRKLCGKGRCPRYCIRYPAFIFLTLFWPYLLYWYCGFVAHPKFVYCIVEKLWIYFRPETTASTLKLIQDVFGYAALIQDISARC